MSRQGNRGNFLVHSHITANTAASVYKKGINWIAFLTFIGHSSGFSFIELAYEHFGIEMQFANNKTNMNIITEGV
jgi:hypothetical protein